MGMKGTFIDYNYLIIIIMFFVVFVTGLALASESIEGIQEITGVTPPTELEACRFVMPEGEIWYQKGTDAVSWTSGIANEHVLLDQISINTLEEGGENHLAPDEPLEHIAIEDWVLTNYLTGRYTEVATGIGTRGWFDIQGTVIVEDMKFYSWTPPGTHITVTLDNLVNETESWSYTIHPDNREDFIGWYEIGQEEIMIGDNYIYVDEEVEIEFELSRDSTDFESPRLSTAEMYGSHIETEDEGVLRRGLRMGRCAMAQTFNLFNIITLQTGHMWIDIILIPFQIALLFFIIKIVANVVSSLPLT